MAAPPAAAQSQHLVLPTLWNKYRGLKGSENCIALKTKRLTIYSPRYLAKNGGMRFQQKKMLPSERASQEEQNDTNFSFIAPSTAEYKDHKE